MKVFEKYSHSVLFRWVCSYLVILLIPMLFSVGIYFYSFGVINNNSEKIYAASLEQIRIEIDSLVSMTFKMLDQLSINNSVQRLIRTENNLSDEDRFIIYKLVPEVMRYKIIFPLIDDVFIVLNRSQSVVSTTGHISADLFYSILDSTKMDSNAFKAFIRQGNQKRIMTTGNHLLFTQGIGEGSADDTGAALVIAVKREYLEGRFSGTDENNGALMYLADRDNILLSSAGSGETMIRAPVFSENDGSAVHIAGMKYFPITKHSEVMNWDYVYLVSEKIQRGQARRIQYFTFAGLVVCFFFGLFVALWMSKTSYNPVKRLVSAFTGDDNVKPPKENEFVWLEKQAAWFLREHKDIKTTLLNNLQVLIEQKIINMMRAGDADSACALLHKVFDMNISREGASSETDFLGILQKGIIRSGNSGSGGSPVDLSSYAIDRTPLKELPGVLEKIVREICLVNTRTQDRNSSQTQLSREIKKYISLNFVDPELNISAIGHHFALTPPYVSLIFKEETGMNMLDYINTFRVEKAKELLEKGLTVKETGEQVGFRRSNTFIRIFKGITGITPKRYQAVRKI